MGYLARHLPLKESPELLLPGVKSAIVVSCNYKNTTERAQTGQYKVARYAVGEDYHLTISRQLENLVQFIQEVSPEAQSFYGVDSRPIAERSLAIKAGIGFRGKNTMVIRPKLGSYFFIGVVLTTAELPIDAPQPGTCGTCTRCIDACPTQAISPQGTMNATACLSYQTIEQKTPMTAEQLSHSEGWIFGCDICQEVCPFNHFHTPLTTWPEFMPESGIGFDGIRNSVKSNQPISIPKTTSIYRSKKRVIANIVSGE